MNRLTVENAKQLLEKHDVKLIHYTYGFGGNLPRAGCVVSLLILRHLDDVDAVKSFMLKKPITFFQTISNITGEPLDYVKGLEYGFEAPTAHRSILTNNTNSPEMRAGYEDGVALRDLA